MTPGSPVKQPRAARGLSKNIKTGRLKDPNIFKDVWVEDAQFDHQLVRAPESVRKGAAVVECLDLSKADDKKTMQFILENEATESNPRPKLIVTHRTIVPPDVGGKNFRALITYRRLEFRKLETPVTSKVTTNV